uniref:Uncharacterized protein n=1 Tax=Chromera velia CCMP2878 TaxID=1169474 RepID=A0A0G4HXT6_9ALVE|eukprot:Cvel_9344.t1-p1 / transcript=Cvel_9344.t1 / gene=Cvel_9344 / organism=Chromera_velia_CCMP2878 / gene_product=Zinc finger protein 850, putative / transcript_product=Zinc finger protein 850, putative / location=Cvel_scaffold536:55785-64974(-) / protein_length=1026 / sequence_SO=supercontig / SO=protein_coding / is_pseudo=false
MQTGQVPPPTLQKILDAAGVTVSLRLLSRNHDDACQGISGFRVTQVARMFVGAEENFLQLLQSILATANRPEIDTLIFALMERRRVQNLRYVGRLQIYPPAPEHFPSSPFLSRQKLLQLATVVSEVRGSAAFGDIVRFEDKLRLILTLRMGGMEPFLRELAWRALRGGNYSILAHLQRKTVVGRLTVSLLDLAALVKEGHPDGLHVPLDHLSIEGVPDGTELPIESQLMKMMALNQTDRLFALTASTINQVPTSIIPKLASFAKQQRNDQTGVSPAGSETGSPFGGAYRVIDDPLAWFVLPVGYSQKDLYKFAQVVYEEGAPMREALGETAGEGETDFGGFGFLEVVSRSSVGGFPGAPIRGVDGRLLRVAHGRARALVGLIGSGGRENVEVVRQCVLQLEQHTPGGLITGVCVQNVPRDISTPFKDLRWNPIGFFSLREIASDASEYKQDRALREIASDASECKQDRALREIASDASAGVISILITNIPNSASEKQLKETLTHAEVPFVGNISLPRRDFRMFVFLLCSKSSSGVPSVSALPRSALSVTDGSIFSFLRMLTYNPIGGQDALASALFAEVTQATVLADALPSALFAIRAPSSVLADPLPSALFALITPSAVLADTLPPTLLALRALPAVLTDTLPPTLLALITPPAVLADTLPPTLLAPTTPSAVFAYTLPSAILTFVTRPAVLADTLPPTLLALITLPAVFTYTLPSAIPTSVTLPAVFTYTLPSAIPTSVTLPAVFADALPSTLLASRAMPAMRANARPPTLLALMTLPAVLTDTIPPTLLALMTLSAVLTDTLSPAILAPTANATVFADALPSTILASRAMPAMLANARPPTLLALMTLPAVLTDTIPPTLLALMTLSAVLTDTLSPAILAPTANATVFADALPSTICTHRLTHTIPALSANPSMQTEDPFVPVPLDFSCVLSLLPPPPPHSHASTATVATRAVLAVRVRTAEETEVPSLEVRVRSLLSPSSQCFPRTHSPLRFSLHISTSRVVLLAVRSKAVIDGGESVMLWD